MQRFLAELKRQRWDDHRYYHHSRINQTLHLVSALSFIAVYVLVFTNPVAAALIGWFFAMVTRQVGHFFFEPKGYDEVNSATHELKEHIKVGYNLKRKMVLLSLWALSPVLLWAQPTLFGIFPTSTDNSDLLRHLCQLWLALGVAALVFRTVQLFIQQSVLVGMAWFTKILTDPFHDIKLYWRAPLQLVRGELLDPMEHVAHQA
ncbi:DUF962 domain-containing protein [Mycobacterium camsae]|uniref:hypothetical protein n=1 Tax=Mycobacterium gordonae TaxID=1778 RepID=UPI00197CDCB3|nr:hypothetical protein [Mycobacterium gordonae]